MPHRLRYFSAACLLAAAAAFSSCKMNVLKGSGPTTNMSPEVAGFDAVDVHVPLRVEINVQPGAKPGVQLSGFKNVIDHIKAKVQDNVLVINTDLNQTWTIDGDGVTVVVTVPSLKGMELHGAPDAYIHGSVTGPSLDINASGASKISVDNVSTDTFDIEVSGAGDLDVKGGTVKYAEYEITGAGEVRAYPLQTTETSVSISGAGSSEVNVSQKLTARISGAGTVKYKGHPQVDQDVSGAGTIKDEN